MREINKRVLEMRKKCGFTQEQLANKMGMRASTYSQMERSGKIPCEVLVEIADVFEIDVRYFCTVILRSMLKTKKRKKNL